MDDVVVLYKYKVVESWTNYRIVEVYASSDEWARDLVASGEGDDVDGGTDDHSITATLIMGGE